MGRSARSRMGFAVLRVAAIVAAAFYVCWNLWWIGHGRVPPSILTGLTGLPCPTTGGTRAMRALLHGDVAASLWFNPLAVPIAALFFASIGAVAWPLARGRAVVVPSWMVWAWAVLLSAAWGMKFVMGREYW